VRAGLAVVATVLPLLLAGCGEDAAPVPQALPDRTEPTLPAYGSDETLPPGQAALALVPAAATVVTVTDFDASRRALGVPDLTGEDPVGDRVDYWERAPRESVLLAAGMLHEHDSVLVLDHGFSSDDVDWEAHFLTPDGPGWALGLRPDLDMGRVEDAVDAGVAGLRGAHVDAGRHLVSSGVAGAGDPTWAQRPGISALTADGEAESTYYRSGCVPLADALGPDAGAEERDDLLAAHDPTDLEPVETFALTFSEGVATARLGPDRPDLFDRSALAEDFPATGPVRFAATFTRAVVDPSTGRIGWTVRDPLAAAGLVLTDALPFAVCPEVTPTEEPTGL
jgi:hypothetical protein